MILIAHRGLVNGPDLSLENKPNTIQAALEQGFHCEIDVRYIDDKWFLGHDRPDYEVPYEFLEQANLWIHAKNIDALYMLSSDPKLNYFWHQEDSFTLTSKGYIWTYPEKPLTSKSIRVLPEWKDPGLTSVVESVSYGVCSDYVAKIKELLSS